MEFLSPSQLVSLDIDNDVGALFDASVYKHSYDELDISQSFASSSDEESCVGAFNLEDNGPVSKFVQHVSVYIDLHG